MKATGIVRRVDDPSQTTLALWEIFSFAMLDLSKRNRWDDTY